MESINLVSQFLAVLLGIAVGIFGREIVTSKNLRFPSEIISSQNYHYGASFILSFIAVFALIEYWRVTNTAIVISDESIQAWILYIDLSLFLTAFISLRGYGSSISTYVLESQNFKDEEKGGFSKALGRSTSFLGVFLFIGLVRYGLTLYFVKNINYVAVQKQIYAHIAGVILCMIACLFFRKDKLKAGFVCSAFGLVVVVVYFVNNNIIK